MVVSIVVFGIIALIATFAMWACCKISGDADKDAEEIIERELNERNK